MDVTYAGRRDLPAGRRAFLGQRRWLVALLGVALLIAAFWGATQVVIPVTVTVGGYSRTLLTTAHKPAAFLAQYGYTLRPADVLQAPDRLRKGAHVVLQPARPVDLQAGGRRQRLYTQASTVGQLLREAGIVLRPGDELRLAGAPAVETDALPPRQLPAPPMGLPSLPYRDDEPALQLTIRRALTLTIVDGDALPARVRTTAATVGEALAAAHVPLYLGDSVFPPPSSKALPGLRVFIRRSLPVTLVMGGETLSTRTRQATVGDALAELGIILMGQDRVQPPLDTTLRPHMRISIVRVQERLLYEDAYLPFDTVWAPDDNLPIDRREVRQEGRAGIKRLRYRLRLEDGQEVSRTLEDEWLAVEPVTKIIAYGRKIVPQTLETPDGAITYWRKIRMFATSYSPGTAGVDPSRPWYGRTRLGLPMRKGIVAVDPAVINLRQEVYVPGYGKGLAGDTGSAIRGKHIDLGYDDHNLRLWRQWVDVYLLWPPPPTYQIHYVLPNWPPAP